MPDIELLAQFVEDALAELVEVSADDAAFALAGRRTGRRTAPRRPGRIPREPSP
jgi:hypothetical protein